MRRLVRCLVVALLVTVPLLVAQAGPALACSCGEPAPVGETLASSDAAFVGVLVAESVYGGPVERLDTELRMLSHFEVERAVKGAVGARIDVLSSGNGASCGLDFPVGERVGLLLHRGPAAWVSSLCHKVEADLLLAASDEPDTSRLRAMESVTRVVVVITLVALAAVVATSVRRRT